MARIDLRNVLFYILDGLSGTATSAAAPAAAVTSLILSAVTTNAKDGGIPVGARLMVAGETVPVAHVVTAVTAGGTSEAPTYACTFSPALGAGTYAVDAAVTVMCQRLEIKVGEGDAKWTESRPYKYDKDRGHLDEVRQGDDEPMDLQFNFTFDHYSSGTANPPSPVDAIKQQGEASEWVTYCSDPCQPYSVGILLTNLPPCVATEDENFLFPDYRVEKIEPDLKNANIAINGKCNAVEPIVTEGPDTY